MLTVLVFIAGIAIFAVLAGYLWRTVSEPEER